MSFKITLLLLRALLRCMKKQILSLAYKKKNGYRGFIFHVLQKLSNKTLPGAAGGPWVSGVCRAPCASEPLGAEASQQSSHLCVC